MRELIKVIFLDIDGVLNGYDVLEHINYTLWKYSCKPLRKFFKKLSHYTDIDKRRVKRLAKICKATGAKVVLSSSWRNSLLSDDGERLTKLPDHKKFWDLMDKYGIEVIGKTPSGTTAHYKREDEIISWLTKHQDIYDIISFIILDDESSDLQCFANSNLVKTSYPGYYGALRCKRGEYTGLNRKYMKEAIKKIKLGVINTFNGDE